MGDIGGRGMVGPDILEVFSYLNDSMILSVSLEIYAEVFLVQVMRDWEKLG